jgi:hypothetical protein
MDRLRLPFFLLAIFLMLVAVLVEVGSSALLGVPRQPITAASFPEGSEAREAMEDLDQSELDAIREDDAPPGLGIPDMALLDGLVLFTIGLAGLSMVIPKQIHGRLQGIVTLIVMILLILGAIALLFATIAQLFLMVGLLLAVPFGTIAYFALYAFFDRGGAAVVLALLMLLKIGFGILLILAHQRFLENKGLVLLVITSLIANVVISFLHGIVPIFLVSITDAVAAIVAIILAIIWALIIGIGSIGSVIKALRPAEF